jgi:hypothetical protein
MHQLCQMIPKVFAVKDLGTVAKLQWCICVFQADAALAGVREQAALEHQQLQQQDAQQLTEPQAEVKPQQDTAQQSQHAGDAGHCYRSADELIVVPRYEG